MAFVAPFVFPTAAVAIDELLVLAGIGGLAALNLKSPASFSSDAVIVEELAPAIKAAADVIGTTKEVLPMTPSTLDPLVKTVQATKSVKAAKTQAETVKTAAGAAKGAGLTGGQIACIGVAAVVVAAGAAYYMYNGPPGAGNANEPGDDHESEETTTRASMGDTAGDPDSGSDSDSDSDSEAGLGRKLLIPKKMMEALLAKAGKDMYNKLGKATHESQRTIWKNQDFRIDPGHTVKGFPNRKSWNLQRNRGASKRIVDSLKGRSTHDKLFWDYFDFSDPPSYDDWVRRIMAAFE